MKFECQSCFTIFSERQAKCLDWRDPKQCFICPNCDKPDKADLVNHARGADVSPRFKKIIIMLAVFFVLIIIPAAWAISTMNVIALFVLILGFIASAFFTYISMNKVASRPYKVVRI